MGSKLSKDNPKVKLHIQSNINCNYYTPINSDDILTLKTIMNKKLNFVSINNIDYNVNYEEMTISSLNQNKILKVIELNTLINKNIIIRKDRYLLNFISDNMTFYNGIDDLYKNVVILPYTSLFDSNYLICEFDFNNKFSFLSEFLGNFLIIPKNFNDILILKYSAFLRVLIIDEYLEEDKPITMNFIIKVFFIKSLENLDSASTKIIIDKINKLDFDCTDKETNNINMIQLKTYILTLLTDENNILKKINNFLELFSNSNLTISNIKHSLAINDQIEDFFMFNIILVVLFIMKTDFDSNDTIRSQPEKFYKILLFDKNKKENKEETENVSYNDNQLMHLLNIYKDEIDIIAQFDKSEIFYWRIFSSFTNDKYNITDKVDLIESLRQDNKGIILFEVIVGFNLYNPDYFQSHSLNTLYSKMNLLKLPFYGDDEIIFSPFTPFKVYLVEKNYYDSKLNIQYDYKITLTLASETYPFFSNQLLSNSHNNKFLVCNSYSELSEYLKIRKEYNLTLLQFNNNEYLEVYSIKNIIDLKNLEQLNLIGLNSHTASKLFKGIKLLKYLRILNISESDLSNCKKYICNLSFLRFVEVINLSNCRLSSIFNLLLNELEKLLLIREIYIKGNDITCCSKLSKVLNNLNYIQILDISDNPLNSSICYLITNSIKYLNSTLRSLNISNTINNYEIINSCLFELNSLIYLNQLSTSFNCIGSYNVFINELFPVCSKMKSLNYLHISMLSCSDELYDAIISKLPYLESLLELYLVNINCKVKEFIKLLNVIEEYDFFKVLKLTCTEELKNTYELVLKENRPYYKVIIN